MLQVDSDFLLVLAALFSSAWKIITSFHVPGTNLNVAEFIFACMMVVFSIRVVPAILGFSAIFGSGGSRDAGNTPQNHQPGSYKTENDHRVGRW